MFFIVFAIKRLWFILEQFLQAGFRAMIVNVSEIKDGGLSLSLTRPPGWLGGSSESDITSVSSDIEFCIDLLRTGNEVVVRGKVGFMATSSCSRCLGDVSVKSDLDINLLLSPSPASKKEKSGGHVDYETYQGKTVDLNDYMREQVNLALPYKVLCHNDCRGLCCGCGRNLNDQQCGCEMSAEDSSFAVLKNIRI